MKGRLFFDRGLEWYRLLPIRVNFVTLAGFYVTNRPHFSLAFEASSLNLAMLSNSYRISSKCELTRLKTFDLPLRVGCVPVSFIYLRQFECHLGVPSVDSLRNLGMDTRTGQEDGGKRTRLLLSAIRGFIRSQHLALQPYGLFWDSFAFSGFVRKNVGRFFPHSPKAV